MNGSQLVTPKLWKCSQSIDIFLPWCIQASKPGLGFSMRLLWLFQVAGKAKLRKNKVLVYQVFWITWMIFWFYFPSITYGWTNCFDLFRHTVLNKLKRKKPELKGDDSSKQLLSDMKRILSHGVWHMVNINSSQPQEIKQPWLWSEDSQLVALQQQFTV